MRLPALLAVLLCLAPFGASAQDRGVFSQGSFERPTEKTDRSPGWSIPNRPDLSIVQEGNRHWLRISNDDPSRVVTTETTVRLDPSWRAVAIQARLKATNLKLGKEGWHDARIAWTFENAQGEMVGGYGPVPNLTASSDWITVEVVREVPEGADHVKLQPAMFYATGVFELDDIRVLPFQSLGQYFAARALPIREGFPEGRFDQAASSDIPLGWNVPSTSQCTMAVTGGRHILRITNDDTTRDVLATGLYRLDPRWAELGFRAQARVSGFRAGPGGWKQARIGAEFFDATGKDLGAGPGDGMGADGGWQEIRGRGQVPQGAAYVRFDIGLSGAAGTMEVADLALAPVSEDATADAELPQGERLTWGEEPVEKPTDRRAEVCLNGLWRFMPATGTAEGSPTASGWGFIRVPGDWSGKMNSIVARGTGPAWRGFAGATLAKGWYERRIDIPADWAGRAILLDFQRVSTDARVSIDGTECGRVEWPAGKVDITRFVTPGKPATLRVLVVAAADDQDALVLMGVGQISTKRPALDARGIIGDVTLVSRPAGPHVGDVFVQPSVRRHEVAVDVELAGVTQPGTVVFVASMCDEKGREEKRFTATAQVTGAPTQVVRLRWPWANPRLWDAGRPNLYTLALEAKGAGVDDAYAQHFGFREFWIEGRRFILNGVELRMRPTIAPEQWSDVFGNRDLIAGQMEGMRAAGFNIQELWPFDHDQRGCLEFREMWSTVADEKGWPLIGAALSMSPIAFTWRSPNWTQPGVRDRWEQRMAAELRRYRNHPSILLWANSANTFGHVDDENPRRIGQSRRQPVWKGEEDGWNRQQALADEVARIIRRYDPTRPVFMHQGGPSADVYATNTYLDLIPLQEREEWLSEWAKTGDMPFMAVEFGTPLDCTFFRGRNGFGDNMVSEPWVTEFSAIYLGRQAYRDETPDYRAEIAAKYVKGQQYTFWQNNAKVDFMPSFQKVEELFVRNTWRAWRTWGISGGMVPWSDVHGWQSRRDAGSVNAKPFQPGQRGTWSPYLTRVFLDWMKPAVNTIHPSGRALLAANGPTLAWLAGPADAFTARDHHFAAGAPVRKAVALLNDTRAEQPYSFSWEALVAGKRIAGGNGSGRIQPAGTLLLPVAFVAPGHIASAKAEGEIRLQARIGGASHEDRFPFRVYSPLALARGTIWTVDPAGRTGAMLRALGYTVMPWHGEQTAKVVVVGREALSAPSGSGAPILASLRSYVSRGGRAIVFAQAPGWLERNLGLRVARHVSRRVYAVADSHPVTRGMDNEDLRDWNGASTLLPAKPLYPPRTSPKYGWHWGNRGAVTSVAIEKPHLAGWRPILECEFDLAYSPLMELDFGKGRLTLCTLDLEDHAAISAPGFDPAAGLLARRVMSYAASAPLSPRVAKVVYLGGKEGADLLDRLGVLYRRADALDTTAGLTILGPDADPDVSCYCFKGGKVLYLPRRSAGRLQVMDTFATLVTAKGYAGQLTVPDGPETRGLSASDLHFRSGADSVVIGELGGGQVNGQLARLPLMKGVAVVCQVDPDRFNADEKTYFRFTRWRQTRALTQVLANMGATFRADARVFRVSGATSIGLAGPWRAKRTVTLPAAANPDAAHDDPGMTDAAKALVGMKVAVVGWDTAQAPGMADMFDATDGEAVFRRTVQIPREWAGRDLTLSLGTVDDFDDTFFNGVRVGGLDAKTPDAWNAKRVYTIPGRLVKAGPAIIAVRIFDRYGGGGFGGKPEDMSLQPAERLADDSLYHPDYREDFELGDNPYRYYRW